MTAVLATYGTRSGVSPAEALQMGMRKLMSEQAIREHPYFAHPFAWASFMVVGEGVPSAN